ncbi:tRNA (guanine-N(7)-)-methyltransferase [Rubripirellula tenax]|uniref:tRNA (guanine-N(7)-)-methyltransferase n=1 Tax=Rubripirellula tenax TaxID=2528015 RepID=A0A5C6EXS1_9BACT|nr:tRNA (guanosine(46)-N7)-methyltransferase TrmB [Rubripirellula tenax]TWU54423.1 tRNA (guanine-N(7)-)-methyltransferase [Rubripirellula tenax]
MPRQQIRSPKPNVDLTAVFREIEQLPESLSSQTMFGNDLPLEIEVGSGKGLFMATESAAHPKHNFLGVEIIGKYASHAAGRLRKAGVTNAIMISGNAEPLFEKKIAAESLEAVHVYFPDPWWKKKHRKRRVVNTTSVQNFSKALRVGGRFHFWTDVLDYFEQTIELIAEIAPEFGVPIPEEEVEATHDLDYRTHFERRSIQQHIPVYRVRYEKRSAQPTVPKATT